MRRSAVLFLAIFFAGLVLLGGGLAAFNFAVDPLQYYRVSRLYKPVFWGGMQRFQNAGVARTYANDVAIVGSSVTENFLMADVERRWGQKAVRLSISGSTPHEQFLVLRLALMTGRVNHVLWGVDYGGFYLPPLAVRDDQGGNFPHYLYRTVPLPNLEYLLSLGTTRLSLLALNGYGITDLDGYHVWYDKFEFSERAVLQSWRDMYHGTCADFAEKYEPATATPSTAALETMRTSVAANILSLAHGYPEVKFHLFLPPMARVAYIPARNRTLPLLLPFREEIVQRTTELNNTDVFDFQSVPELADDLTIYKDPIHFDLATSQTIIRAIWGGENLLDSGNLRAKNAMLIEATNSYDLCRDAHSPVAAAMLR